MVASSSAGGPKFAASCLWFDTLDQLAAKCTSHGKAKIDLAGHRQPLCLNGTDIVDAVLKHVTEHRSQTASSTPPRRENARRLCQHFLDTGSLVPVNFSGREFKDRTAKWYRVDAGRHPLFGPPTSPPAARRGLRRRSISMGGMPLTAAEPKQSSSGSAHEPRKPAQPRPPTPAKRITSTRRLHSCVVPAAVSPLAVELEEVAGVPSQPFVPYCKQRSLKEYEEVRRKTTEKSLSELLERILNDSSMLPDVKRQHLRKFQARHPKVYRKYFQNYCHL